MNAAIRHCVGLAILSWGVAAIAADAEEATPAPGADEANSPADEIRHTIGAYVEAYNRSDAAAVAATWVEQGVYVDETSGDQIAGRNAIERVFAAMFQEAGTQTLAANVDAVRFVRPDVAHASGEAVTESPDQAPRHSAFTAILVRDDGRWLLDSVYETATPAIPDAHDRLQDLEFLVGRWVDESTEADVETTVRWGANRSFLVRSCTLQRDTEAYQCTQVIGWDPRMERVRCWMFDSDGSFGEGTWSPSEDGWVVQMSQTLADGRVAGGTQLVTIVDNDTLSVQIVGQEIEGAMQPATDLVRVVRVATDIDEQ